tara:strand:+ start:275 stop:1759 length:1485 start_codon:yes stop_codon:yes gene_type:complete
MSYNIIKTQQPAGPGIKPVGQELIFVWSCLDAVRTELNVKYVIGLGTFRTLGTFYDVGSFKTTPNNAGVGMVDFSNLMSNYVGADNVSKSNSTWKGQASSGSPVPIHLIDMYSLNTNALRGFLTITHVEYIDSAGVKQTTANGGSNMWIMMNAYIKTEEPLFWTNNLFTGAQYGGGYYMQKFEMSTINYDAGKYGKFLSNSPTTQWARKYDYGTMAYIQASNFNIENKSAYNFNDVTYYKFTFYPEYDAVGSVGHTKEVTRTENFGAFDGITTPNISHHLLYFGAFPANIIAIDSSFSSKVGIDILSYTVETYNKDDERLSETKIINISCNDHRDYEPIRLTWLNQWGTWDYYTFMQKSTKTIKTKGTTYSPPSIQWNKTYSKPSNSSSGGKRTFRVNATETIKMNTDYITEDHSEWFEELINSPEVYQLRDRYGIRREDMGTAAPAIGESMNEYVTPVLLKTTSLVKKTKANDGLIQYTFEIEKSKKLNTQTV